MPSRWPEFELGDLVKLVGRYGWSTVLSAAAVDVAGVVGFDDVDKYSGTVDVVFAAV